MSIDTYFDWLVLDTLFTIGAGALCLLVFALFVWAQALRDWRNRQCDLSALLDAYESEESDG